MAGSWFPAWGGFFGLVSELAVDELAREGDTAAAAAARQPAQADGMMDRGEGRI